MKEQYRTIQLDTERWLEPLKPGEEDELFAVVQRNKVHLRRFLSWPKDDHTVETYRNIIGEVVVEWADETNENYRYAIRQENVGILGHIALLRTSEDGLPNIGYWLSEEYTGRGIAGRALQKLTGLAHEELEIPTVELEIRRDNESSERIARKAEYEFVKEITKEGHAAPYGIWRSMRES